MRTAHRVLHVEACLAVVACCLCLLINLLCSFRFPFPFPLSLCRRAKHDAWTAQKGKSQDVAKAEYVALVEGLVAAEK